MYILRNVNLTIIRLHHIVMLARYFNGLAANPKRLMICSFVNSIGRDFGVLYNDNSGKSEVR